MPYVSITVATIIAEKYAADGVKHSLPKRGDEVLLCTGAKLVLTQDNRYLVYGYTPNETDATNIIRFAQHEQYTYEHRGA